MAPTPEAALNRLYNFDFQGAHHELSQWDAAHPGDPLGPALQAATYMFTEFAGATLASSIASPPPGSSTPVIQYLDPSNFGRAAARPSRVVQFAAKLIW
jgi:hypothetical protein